MNWNLIRLTIRISKKRSYFFIPRHFCWNLSVTFFIPIQNELSRELFQRKKSQKKVSIKKSLKIWIHKCKK